jgi:hypothetical protein
MNSEIKVEKPVIKRASRSMRTGLLLTNSKPTKLVPSHRSQKKGAVSLPKFSFMDR